MMKRQREVKYPGATDSDAPNGILPPDDPDATDSDVDLDQGSNSANGILSDEELEALMKEAAKGPYVGDELVTYYTNPSRHEEGSGAASGACNSNPPIKKRKGSKRQQIPYYFFTPIKPEKMTKSLLKKKQGERAVKQWYICTERPSDEVTLCSAVRYCQIMLRHTGSIENKKNEIYPVCLTKLISSEAGGAILITDKKEMQELGFDTLNVLQDCFFMQLRRSKTRSTTDYSSLNLLIRPGNLNIFLAVVSRFILIHLLIVLLIFNLLFLLIL